MEPKQKGKMMSMLKRIYFGLMFYLFFWLCHAAEMYKIDKAHSTLGFKVAHLGISSVTGRFKDFEGFIEFNAGQLISSRVKIDASSVFTDNEKRDAHLKKDDFFDVEEFPEIKFESVKITQYNNHVKVKGNLTIRDVTKMVHLEGKFGGKVYVKQWKMYKTGLELKGSINRQDFGLKFNEFLGTGEAMVGDKVELNIAIEANLPSEEGPVISKEEELPEEKKSAPLDVKIESSIEKSQYDDDDL